MSSILKKDINRSKQKLVLSSAMWSESSIIGYDSTMNTLCHDINLNCYSD